MWIRHVIINKGFHRHHSLFISKNGYRMQINGILPCQFNTELAAWMNLWFPRINPKRMFLMGKKFAFHSAERFHCIQLLFFFSFLPLNWLICDDRSLKNTLFDGLRWQINKIGNIAMHKILAFMWTVFTWCWISSVKKMGLCINVFRNRIQIYIGDR